MTRRRALDTESGTVPGRPAGDHIGSDVVARPGLAGRTHRIGGAGRSRQTAAATCGVIAFNFSSRARTSAWRVATAGSDCLRGRGRSMVMSS